MTNLVEITIRTKDDTAGTFDAVKARAAKAGAEAAEAFNAAFKLKADAHVSGGEGLGDIGGLGGADSSIMNKLKSYANTPGGIGLLGTGNDTSLVTTLKRQILSGQEGLLSGLGSGGESGTDLVREVLANNVTGNVSTEDFVKQILEGTGPSDVTTTDMIRQQLEGNSPGNVDTTDYIRQQLEGDKPGNVTTTDTVKIETDKTGLASDAKDDADSYGDDFSTELKKHLDQSSGGGSWISGLLNSGSAVKDAEDAGEDLGGAVDRGISDGIKKGGGGGGSGGIWSTLTEGISSITDGIMPAIIGAAAVLAPAIAQVLGGGIIAGLGAALSGMAIYGAMQNAGVKKSFDQLKTDANKDLTDIGKPFVPVMNSIFSTASSVMGKLTPVFAGAAGIISGPFQTFADTLLKTFDQPAVQQSIDAVAKAFAAILKALTPQLSSDMTMVANAITAIANNVAKNPQAFADFVKFIVDVGTGTLDAVNGLSEFAEWLEKVGGQAIQGLLSGAQSYWGTAVTWFKGLAHTIESLFDDAVSWLNPDGGKLISGLESGAKTAWNIAYDWLKGLKNTITGAFSGAASWLVSGGDNVISGLYSGLKKTWGTVSGWFSALKAVVTGFFSDAVHWLVSDGGNVISGFLTGLKDAWVSVVNWFGSLPSKILAALGIHSPPAWAISAGKDIMDGIAQGAEARANGVIQTAKNTAAAAAAAAGSAQSASGGSIEAMMKSMAAARGWTGDLWTDLYNVEEREAGFDMTATNPSSGAYGLAQFIGGPSEYAEYGGNANTAAGQITAMLNYIAQRYGTPAGAWAHEENYGWYGSGGATSAGWGIVGEHGPELLKLPGGATVVPHGTSAQMVAGGQAAATLVQLEISGGGQSAFEQFMLKMIREWVRVKGGGNVQTAFGRN